MELFGKVVSSGKKLDLNTPPELLINIKNGRITVKSPITDKIGENALIGFGYDSEKEMGSLAYLYTTDEGCKIGSKGTVSSKYHANHLKNIFLGEDSKTTRFTLEVNLESPVIFQENTLYPLVLKEELKELTRTKASVEIESVKDESKIDADIATAENSSEDWNNSDTDEQDIDNSIDQEQEVANELG